MAPFPRHPAPSLPNNLAPSSTFQVITSAGFRFLFRSLHSQVPIHCGVDRVPPVSCTQGNARMWRPLRTFGTWQVWAVIIAYMEGVAQVPTLLPFPSTLPSVGAPRNRRWQGPSRDEVLRFIFSLSFLQLGQYYPVQVGAPHHPRPHTHAPGRNSPATSVARTKVCTRTTRAHTCLQALTDTQRALLLELRQFGLVYMTSSDSRRYYPTKLALSLSTSPADATDTASAPPLSSSSPDAAANAAQSQHYVIVETNFKLYAYTTAPLQLKILGLFVRYCTARQRSRTIGVLGGGVS